MRYQFFEIFLLLNFVFGSAHIAHAQSIIGGTNGDESAILELRSSSQGLLLPRLTSEERSAIVNPAESLLIFNTTEGCLEINLGSSANPDWFCLLAKTGRVTSVDCESTTYTGNLTAGITASGVSCRIIYEGGSGGFYGTQSVASTGVTGLTASIKSGSFEIGSGSVTFIVTGTPSSAGMATFTFTIGGQTCTRSIPVSPAWSGTCGAYVASGVWKEFMCHNLGANASADPFEPSWELVGNYYQWGRNPTCFGRDGIDDENQCAEPVYGAAAPWGGTLESDNSETISGWSNVLAPAGSWQDDAKSFNDPCPVGYRLPTVYQWMGVLNTSLNSRLAVGTWTFNSIGYDSGIKIGSSLFLQAAGNRRANNGLLFFRNNEGFYRSSSSDSYLYSFIFAFGVDFATIVGNYEKLAGASVRCIAE